MAVIEYCFVLLAFLFAKQTVVCEVEINNDTPVPLTNETSISTYMKGVDLGIINMKKYSFESFQKDEQNIFQGFYEEYRSFNGSLPVNYEEWLIMNNFGILPDTQESLFQRKISKRSTADNKRRFVNTVRKGDILITGRRRGGHERRRGGLVGHAAIMTTDYWVLEMPGGVGWQNGISSNNRQINKHAWFDEYASDWTTVYRCPDGTAAREAAVWADHTYYNPSGGEQKVKHITYKLSTDIWSTNPSYCSKLVIQAYYFGTGKKKVIRNLSLIGRVIVPSTIPLYFLRPYKLVNKGKY